MDGTYERYGSQREWKIIKAHIAQHAEGKAQWDHVAGMLGADGDNVDAVFHAAEKHAELVANETRLAAEVVKMYDEHAELIAKLRSLASKWPGGEVYADELLAILDAQPVEPVAATESFVVRVAWGSFTEDGYWKPNPNLLMSAKEQKRQNEAAGYICVVDRAMTGESP
jgi:hypothetical protein